ncbi:MAG: hypothetical protein FWH10_06180 [Oscillospiraceae bacterium]|nr:hypothetical protein [Oscillospiraceae bacterium]
MKRTIALLVVFALIAALAVIPAAAAPGNQNFGDVKKISDGDIDMSSGERDAAWDYGLAIPVTFGEPGDASGTTWVLWSDTAYYFYTEVNDTTPVSMDYSGWTDGEYIDAWVSDSVEIFIAVEGEAGDFDARTVGNFDEACWQFRIDRDGIPSTYQRNGAWTDDFLVGASVNGDRLEWAVKTDGNKYYTKHKITMLSAPKPGEMGLQIQINDLQEEFGGAPQTRANDASGSWDTDQFGYAVLVDEPAMPEPEPEPVVNDGGGDAAPTPTPAPTPPRTGDAGTIALIIVTALAAMGIVVFRRKSVR